MIKEINPNEYFLPLLEMFIALQSQHPDSEGDLITMTYLLTSKLLQPNAKVFGAFNKEGKLVGFNLVYELSPTHLFSDGIWIEPKYRKSLLAGRLANNLLTYAKENYKKLSTDASSEDSISLSCKKGARISHIRYTKEF